MAGLLFSFDGRINRARYWLVQAGLLAAYAIAFAAMGGAAMLSSGNSDRMLDKLGPITGITMAAVLVVGWWIGLAVTVKRFHDHGKSGWWVLIAVIPVVGVWWVLVVCGFRRGMTGINVYGADPLAVA